MAKRTRRSTPKAGTSCKASPRRRRVTVSKLDNSDFSDVESVLSPASAVSSSRSSAAQLQTQDSESDSAAVGEVANPKRDDLSGKAEGDASTYGVTTIDLRCFGRIAWSYGRRSIRFICGHHKHRGFDRTLRPSMTGHRPQQGRPLGLAGLFLLKPPDFKSARKHKRWILKHKHRQRRRLKGRDWLGDFVNADLTDLFAAERRPRTTEAAEPRKCP